MASPFPVTAGTPLQPWDRHCPAPAAQHEVAMGHSVRLNDVHARLNACAPASVQCPVDPAAAARLVQRAARQDRALVAMGARHAMGGQQFLDAGVVVDTSRLSGVEAFDRANGRVTVLAGTRWPLLLAWLEREQRGAMTRWTVRQKQTGGDDFSIGGSIAANIHGRGLCFGPFVEDVEWMDIVDPSGCMRRLSRDDHADLFARVAGGYGLFGLVVRACLRLVPERTLQRRVSMQRVEGLVEAFDREIAQGCAYGDFQFAIDPDSDDFLDQGILSCYRPVEAPPDPDPVRIGETGFRELLLLAHTDKRRAFETYARFYLGSDGQRYRHAEQQSGLYLGDYHQAVDRACGHVGSEMISELYVPRARLARFMRAAADSLRQARADVVYGTIRLIEADQTTTLPWAREAWACVVFNLHVRHDARGIVEARRAFRGLIDRALEQDGSFYLTYHRWATPEQVEAAYPRFREFLAAKKRLDPRLRFQSNWYRHWEAAFSGAATTRPACRS